ncbi:unnamed protein product [Ceratitis capitata]|uniref:(Mediterranean fruit fly) hypothetical protein n=1 Tax=Ceratitis capitata TaxID=7213 RepID=A0A811UNR8_CERCA|nr:unnamed protein product [Ceratitis capitata]
MTPVLKYIVGLLVFLCFLQAIGMARIPRDNGDAQKLNSELAINLQEFLDDITEKFKTVVAVDSIQKVFDDFGKSLYAKTGSASV